jgi:hypothetical protein
MLNRYLTLTLTAAAILAAPAAFAGSSQTKASVATKTKQAPARQAYGAVATNVATNSGEGVAVARPPAQPGAW